MSIADVVSGSQASSAAANAANSAIAKNKDQLGQNEFMQLMLAQLKNQDPMHAMDPSQFLGQLAQFGTVTGIQGLQTAFSTFSDSMRSSQVLQGATMVGRDVLVASDTATLGAQGEVKGAINIPDGVSSVQVNVRDAAGQLVRSLTLPSSSAGFSEFSWDGVANDGNRAPAGEYTLEAVATAGGQSASLETMLAGHVSSVTIDSNNGLNLNTSNLGTVSLSQVRRVM
jgi:flagellar basal-body rod modification protein FlgD